ncbi:MAG: type II toxin-antitoxin system Phd/YefM family antitoxin [Chloroflexi bacterium]|nr:type II toxin-antitoxin system Phd/YefM family antitoxin [Chloroflexota bacterium]
MKVYTYSEARQNLAALLDAALQDGAVLIRRRSGQSFVVQPDSSTTSPLDVEGVDLGVTTDEIVATVREDRERNG